MTVLSQSIRFERELKLLAAVQKEVGRTNETGRKQTRGETCLLDAGGLPFAPPHDVSAKSGNANSKDDPSKDLSSVSSLGRREHLGDSFTSLDVLSVVRVGFHAFFALECGVFVRLLAHFLDLDFTIVVVFGARVAVGGDKSSGGIRKTPSV